MRAYTYLDVNTKRTGGLDTLFPGWQGAAERVCVYSPHDDDAILGAGYAMRAALDAGAEVYLIIVCNGDAGYSDASQKDTIVATRKAETLACYEAFGIERSHILFLDCPDFSALSYVGRDAEPTRAGHFKRTITFLREHAVTRVLAPNHYHEHIDHLAAHLMAAYDAPQSGDAFSVDWASPAPVTSVAEYSVWADLDPEDALVQGRDPSLRANTVLIATPAVEDAVIDGIKKYASQVAIIADLVQQRQARRIADGRFIEVYQRFDPRPKLNFAPYQALIASLQIGGRV